MESIHYLHRRGAPTMPANDLMDDQPKLTWGRAPNVGPTPNPKPEAGRHRGNCGIRSKAKQTEEGSARLSKAWVRYSEERAVWREHVVDYLRGVQQGRDTANHSNARRRARRRVGEKTHKQTHSEGERLHLIVVPRT